MIRTECLPDLQEKLDTTLRKRLRTLLTFVLLVLSATGLAICALFLNGSREQVLPRIIGADGHTQVGWAIPVTPTLLISEGEPPDGAQLSLQEADRIPLTKVRTSSAPSGAKITLLRVSAPLPDQPVPVISGADNGQHTQAVGPSQEKWEGVLVERKALVFEPQPAMTLPSGLPVYASADKSMVGITSQTLDGISVVSMSAVMALFPEIKSGQ
jgi:hypothetical protein